MVATALAVAAARRNRRLRLLALTPLAAILLAWIWIAIPFTRGQNLDWAMYDAAARLLAHGANPYNHVVLLHLQQAIERTGPRYNTDLTRVADPPILFWVLRPLAALPFSISSTILDIVLLVAFVPGVVGTLSVLGVSHNRAVALTILACVFPQTTLYILNGNIGIALFGCIGVGLWLGQRQPIAAGFVLSLAFLKPQIALPLAGIVILFHTADLRKSLAAGVAGIAAQVVGGLVLCGPSATSWWLAGLRAYPNTLGQQGAIPTLAGLFVFLPPADRSAVSLGLAGAAAIVTCAVLWRMRNVSTPIPLVSLAPLWIVWFLAAPFGHPFDDVFLIPPLAAMFVARPCFWVSLGLAYAFLLGLVPAILPGGVSLAPVPVLLSLGIALVNSARKGDRQHVASAYRQPQDGLATLA